MDFSDEIKALATRIPKVSENICTEEATKNALIMPFLNILGYNVFDPTEVVPEFTADHGTNLEYDRHAKGDEWIWFLEVILKASNNGPPPGA